MNLGAGMAGRHGVWPSEACTFLEVSPKVAKKRKPKDSLMLAHGTLKPQRRSTQFEAPRCIKLWALHCG